MVSQAVRRNGTSIFDFLSCFEFSFLITLKFQSVFNFQTKNIKSTGLRPIYVIFFEFLPISFQMENNDNMRL